MKQLFINTKTQQVVEVPIAKPQLYSFQGVLATEEMLNSCGWQKADLDPGYRGMPDQGDYLSNLTQKPVPKV